MVMMTLLPAAIGSELEKTTEVVVIVGVAGISDALPLTDITCREAAS